MQFKKGNKVTITSSRYKAEVLDVRVNRYGGVFYTLKMLETYPGIINKGTELEWKEDNDMRLISSAKKNHLPDWM